MSIAALIAQVVNEKLKCCHMHLMMGAVPKCSHANCRDLVLACRELVEDSGISMESAMFDAIFQHAAQQDKSGNTCSLGSFMRSRQQCLAHQLNVQCSCL